MSSEQTAEKFSPAQYNQFIAGLDLRGIRLLETSVEAKVAGPVDKGTRVRLDYGGAWEDCDGGFRAFATYRVRFSLPGSRKADARINSIWAVEFATPQPMTDALFGAFCEVNLRLNTWPYERELVQSMLARLDWPQLPLPLLKVPGRRMAVRRSPGPASD